MRGKSPASFGKRIEHWIISLMLKEGMEVYVPLVDDHAVDAVVIRPDGTTALIQVKAHSEGVVPEGAAQFSVRRPEPEKGRKDYWYVFYSERFDRMWIMTSEEFKKNSKPTRTGKYRGLRYIRFSGKRQGPLDSYVDVDKNFRRIRGQRSKS